MTMLDEQPAHAASVNATPLLSARDVRKTYRLGKVEVPVLRGCSLDVAPGECVAVLGASGSGKSTLLHLLGGLDRPDKDSGAITFEGSDLRRMGGRGLDRYRTDRVGFVFQFYHLLPELDVLQNALLPSMVRLNRLAFIAQRSALKERATQTLTRFGLGDRLRHKPRELSGGERQRVAIARALMNEPDVLLADEPTGNLDAKTGASILDAMMGYRAERGQTMVIVTHDSATADRADRIVHLDDGMVVSGAPAS